jgi:5-methylcytosine-specific restriction endonuclease McrA
MRDYSLTHLSDTVLLRDLHTLIVQERDTAAAVLAHLAEVDARRLYVPLGYSSMHGYCMEELRFSEDAAYKRIQAARAAREFPILFTELAEGRLHLTAVCLLAPHLTPENAEELVRAAAHRRKSEIEDLLAVCSQLAKPGSCAQGELAPEQVGGRTGELALEQVGFQAGELAAQQVGGPAGELAPEQVGGPGAGSLLSQVQQLVPVMVRPETRDRLRYLQALLSHAIPSGDPSDVLDRAFDLLTEHVEKRRFGTGNGLRRRRTAGRTRYIPANVRHAVWNRDQGRCTFVGTNGHRCHSESFLEFDHVDPRRREDSVPGLRLRCRAHNQYEAERVFGTEFMKRKREETRRAAVKRREEARLAVEKRREDAEARAGVSEEDAEARARAAEKDAEVEGQIRDVLSALRGLGIRGEQARRAAAHARTLPSATLADRIRAALQFHGECIMRSPKAARALYASG